MNQRRQCAVVRTTLTLALAIIPLMLATPSSASAYADPGSGAFVYQAAYAVFLGGTFYLRKFLNRIFGRRK